MLWRNYIWITKSAPLRGSDSTSFAIQSIRFLNVSDVIRLAQAAPRREIKTDVGNEILLNYTLLMDRLSVSEIIQLSQACWDISVQNKILVEGARKEGLFLTVSEIITLANQASEISRRDEILLDYASLQRSRLEFADFRELRKAARLENSIRKIDEIIFTL
jgi:hypothetical protein